MSEPVNELSGAEPAYVPYLRFARNVLLVDLVMGAAVFVVSVWQGWTSVEESTTAIFVSGGALLVFAGLPFAGPMLEGLNRGQGGLGGPVVYEHYAATTADTLKRMEQNRFSSAHLRFTLTLVAAGAIPMAYAATVSALFL